MRPQAIPVETELEHLLAVAAVKLARKVEKAWAAHGQSTNGIYRIKLQGHHATISFEAFIDEVVITLPDKQPNASARQPE